MDGILIIDKPKDYTSRDVVNVVGKKFHTKKIGHTGTLDPLATGVLVVCINKGTKLVELLSALDKEYIAIFEFGTLTDTLDNTGNILKNEKISIDKTKLQEVLNKMIGNYNQVVPIYSAVKVNGKKLYEYARNNEEVELPVHNVEIYDLELLDFYEQNFKPYAKIRCHVSKGTYIRSLGNDIANYLNTNAIMTDLRRVKQGKFLIENAMKLDEINENTELISITECLSNYYKVVANTNIRDDIRNGRSISNVYDKSEVLFVDNNNIALALYQSNEEGILKPWKMFKID